MKLLIEIPEHIYEHAKELSEDSRDEGEAMRAIANGSRQESRSEIPNTCGDAISREAMHIELEKWITYGEYKYSNATKYLYDRIDRLPSVSPKQRTGRWIVTDDDLVYCSECEDSYYPRPIDASWYYCPHCGAKMEEEE